MTTNYTTMASNELVNAFIAGSADVKAAITIEMKRRDNALATAQTAGFQCSVTASGGYFFKDPKWTALKADGTGEYTPGLNIFCRGQLEDLQNPESAVRKAMSVMLAMSPDEIAKSQEAASVKKASRPAKKSKAETVAA